MKRKTARWKKTIKNLFITAFFWLIFQLTIDKNLINHSIPVSQEEQFIEELAPYAQQLSDEYQVLPSIVMAQAILESDWGTSELAVVDNNYFGIKGDAEDPLYGTLEYEEDWQMKDANFRSYDNMYESMQDYARLLHQGTTWNPSQYADVLAATNYLDAARAMQAAGYATDPNYGEKLIEMIELHHLDQYDPK